MTLDEAQVKWLKELARLSVTLTIDYCDGGKWIELHFGDDDGEYIITRLPARLGSFRWIEEIDPKATNAAVIAKLTGEPRIITLTPQDEAS